jgi:hypothetical protein
MCSVTNAALYSVSHAVAHHTPAISAFKSTVLEAEICGMPEAYEDFRQWMITLAQPERKQPRAMEENADGSMASSSVNPASAAGSHKQ